MTLDTEGTPTEENRSGFYPTEERWYMCDRCGWWYPKSETRLERWSGLRACLKDYEEESYHNETLRAMRLQSIFQRREEQTE